MKNLYPAAFAGRITHDTIEDLLAHHRAIFGGLRMEDDGGDDGGGGGDDGKSEFVAPKSQEEFDRMLSDRLRRERAKFADYDELKAKAEAHDKAIEDAKTESEKAVDAARAEGEKTATERTNARLVNAEVRAQAASAKFRDPKDAIAHLDLSKIAVGEDGEVDEKAVTEALKELATSKPYLIDEGKKPGPKADLTQGGGGGDDKPSVDRGRELFAAGKKKTS